VRSILRLATGLGYGFGGDGHRRTLVGTLRHHAMA
jgi:hypothetical protein